MRPSTHRSNKVQSRSGTILLAVFVCLLVSVSIIFASLQISIRSRQETKSLGLVNQISFLLDAGIARAIDQIRTSPQYVGEVWKPTFANATSLTNERDVNSIEIRVAPKTTEDSKGEVFVDIIARIESSDASIHSIQQSYQFTFKQPNS